MAGCAIFFSPENGMGVIHTGKRQLFAAPAENQRRDPTVDCHPEESIAESEVKTPVSISAVSEANSELQQRSLSPAVSQSQAQRNGEHESGKSQVACHLTGCEFSRPGTSSQHIGIQTANKLWLSQECGENISVLGPKQEPEGLQLYSADEKSNRSENPTVDWNPEEPFQESEVTFPVIASVVSEADSDLSQSQELIEDKCENSKSTRQKFQRIHTDERPHARLTCSKRFLRKVCKIAVKVLHKGLT